MFVSINGGKLPEAATKGSAGIDVFTNEDVEIWSGFQVTAPLGIKLDLEFIQKNDMRDNFFLDLRVRSSMRLNGISSLGDGVVDLSFPDEIKIILFNHNQYGSVKFKKGDKVGQFILIPHNANYTWQYRQTDTERCGGFGHSGK